MRFPISLVQCRFIEFCAADLKATFQLQILGVKKNPQSPMYTQLGVLTKGTVIEVNVSELGMVTAGGKVVFGKYAQITNNPENDGCINAVLRASSNCPSSCFALTIQQSCDAFHNVPIHVFVFLLHWHKPKKLK